MGHDHVAVEPGGANALQFECEAFAGDKFASLRDQCWIKDGTGAFGAVNTANVVAVHMTAAKVIVATEAEKGAGGKSLYVLGPRLAKEFKIALAGEAPAERGHANYKVSPRNSSVGPFD